MNSISNIDDLIKEFTNTSIESRRHLVGKYSSTESFSENIDYCYRYKGNKICHHKFDFTDKGTRCMMCNSLCLLSEDGNIISDREILIKRGNLSGKYLIVKQYENKSLSEKFGFYELDMTLIDSHISNITNIRKLQRMINRSCDLSHLLAISLLINSNDFTFKTSLIGYWICEKVNVLNIKYSNNKLINTTFDNKMLIDSLYNIIKLCSDDSFNHGSPCSDDLSLINESHSVDLGGGKKKIINSKLNIVPGIYSSFKISCYGRNIFYVGKNSVIEIEEPNWNVSHIFGVKCGKSTIHDSPCMEEYTNNRLTVFKPSKEIVNYIRLTGINVFPQLNLFIYLTIFLLNRSYYNCYINHPVSKKFEKLFVSPDEHRNYMILISQNIGKNLNADEIVDLIISSNIRIRGDILKVIPSLIIEYM